MLVRAESEESKYQSQVLVCPDGKVSCSVGANGATCCPAGKTFMCCEYSDATCCNSYSCCPYWAPGMVLTQYYILWKNAMLVTSNVRDQVVEVQFH